VEQTPENIGAIVARLGLYAHYPNFPKTDEAVEELAKRMLKFLHNKPLPCGALAGSDENGRSHSINDVDALFDWIAEENRFLPLPVDMRYWHGRYFPPADGKEATTAFASES